MIRRPPRSTHCISSAASDVYKRQKQIFAREVSLYKYVERLFANVMSVSYTHLRAHETRHDLVCRLLLEKKKKIQCEKKTTNNKTKNKNNTKNRNIIIYREKE
eukprot:TRINITY_DN10599_c0_g1_i1.p3 TRINITY_DN10599_c0_g1~~TRINITY_DN10599_c0_g1_i1.p3  ORF type:complete len:103 (-),score=37.42 TRINITY_DN10599_c0_g1_i1:12-320(-)